MNTLLLFSLAVSALASGVLGFLLARSYSKREKIENEWRERERRLIDQLLTNNGAKPLIKFEHEKVIKVPDPETPQFQSEMDVAFFESEIVEEIEHARGLRPQSLTVSQAKAEYGQDWTTWERRLREAKTPLRAG